LLVLDIDGTLTVDRESTIIPTIVIDVLRIVGERGVLVSLLSSNALPVVVGLKKYMGINGPVVGETGALVYIDDVYHLTNRSSRDAFMDVVERYGEFLQSSWQNMFRIHDYALVIKREYMSRDREIYDMVRKYVEPRYDYVRVGYSGYAIHLTPSDVDKGKALLYILDKLGIDPGETIGVGDSSMDYDFIKYTGLKVAVGNADEDLKMRCDIVLEKPSGYGVVDLVKKFLLNH